MTSLTGEFLKPEPINITKNEAEEIRKENNHEYFISKFNFIKQSMGLRPGEIHVLLGTTGSGKSTLMRSILHDFLRQIDTSILLWLSEESLADLKKAYSKSQMDFDLLKVIEVFSEIEVKEKQFKTLGEFKKAIENLIERTNPRLVVFDNMTTSVLFVDRSPREQSENSRWLKQIAMRKNIPFLIVAHTKKDISDNQTKLIDEGDIRGNSTISNLSPYFYIFQRFIIGETYFPTIRIRKSRHHQIDSMFFRLIFDKEKNTYSGDKAITWQDFKTAFQKSNNLTGKN